MRRTTFALAVACAGGCTTDAPVTPRTVGLSAHQAASAAGLAYDVTVLPKFTGGGALSRGSAIDNRGWVSGYSTTSLGARHAALWRDDGDPLDLGALGTSPTLRSTVQWVGMNNTGLVVGISQTDAPAPRGESWSCTPFLGVSGKICLGFFWEGGTMNPLPTLGGPNGYAAAVNNRGQVVGWAETLVEDPTCNAPQVYQFRAVLWEPKKGTVQQLPPFPGDSASAATSINDRGQAVGISGDCDVAVGRWSARRAVLWDHGVVSEIPNLGGEAWHTPAAINNAGVVVGFSNPPGVTGGDFVPHAFLWRPGSPITDLEVLPDGDDNSQAFDVNARGQVVGTSCKGNDCRAFVWQDGVMYNLRELVDPGVVGVFLSARSINDKGEITGNIALPNGEIRAFVATPRPAP